MFENMDGWFDLSMPWYQFVLRGAAAYVGLLILMRLAGKHAFAELSPIDVLVLVIVGGVLRSAVVGDDKSVLGSFIAVATILVLDRVIAQCSAMSPRIYRIVAGSSIVLAKNGRIFRDRLIRHALSIEDFQRAMRDHEIPNPDCIAEARLEANGKITFARMDR
ncbi:MAG TPA: YetF domain-containing protein [Rudaea sp.]